MTTAQGTIERDQVSGTMAGLTAIVAWSTTVAFARSLSEQVGALAAAGAVYLIGGGVFWIRRRLFPGRGRGWQGLPGRYLWGCGSLFLVYTLCLFLGVGMARDRGQVLEVGLVNYLWPALTLWLSLPLLGGRARWPLVPGTILALAGMGLVMTEGAEVSWTAFRANLAGNPGAYAWALLGAIAWALYSNLTRRWGEGDAAGAVGLFLPVTGGALMLLHGLGGETGRWTASTWGEAAFLGVATAAAYGLWEHAMRRGNLVLVGVCSYFTPLLSTVVSCLYLQVVPGSRLWIGCGLLVLGSLLSWRGVACRPTRI